MLIKRICYTSNGALCVCGSGGGGGGSGVHLFGSGAKVVK